VFNSDKLMALAERMGSADKKLFPVDAALIDWDKYFKEIHVAGLNHYGMVDRSKVEAPVEIEDSVATDDVTPVQEGSPA
jgi:hypothetical protein